jgi:hypothetical protein
MAAWLDIDFGGWRLEYIGNTAEEKFLKDQLAEDYPGIILTPAP